MDLVAGQSLGRYEIAGILGVGGMGEVYRARDTQLGRDVAVKVISSKVAQSRRAIDRFEQEAKAVAQLSHPNILDIHDFGRDGGVVYAVTELLEGNDLRDRMRGSMLPVSKALEIGIAVANGLAAAHSKGIIHRDIKPDNIFVTSTGQVKILDFGIARLRERPTEGSSDASSAPTDTLTSARGLVGTVGYMSPEQIDGKPVDQRSDIFGLGCVMYEILTGTRAFWGKTSTDTMLAILGKDPVGISTLCPEVPQAVEAIVERCLEKQPGERFESARDVAFALRAVSGKERSSPPVRLPFLRDFARPALKVMAVATIIGLAMILGAKVANIWPSPPPDLPETKHLAILPFQAGGENVELAQYAAGISEILAEDLEWLARADVHDSWVVPTAVSRGSETYDVDSIHRRYQPNVVLTGVVNRQGPLLRLELTAIEPESGSAYETADFEADLGNVSSLQIEPTGRASAMVGLEFRDENREVLRDRTTNVARAYDLYVRARGVMASVSSEADADVAVDLLHEATSLDPLFWPAHEALAQALAVKFDDTGDQLFFDRSMEILERLSQSRQSEKTFRIMASLYSSNGANEEAVVALESAVTSAPKSGEAYHELGKALQKTGRIADAERALERSINLRPGYWYGWDSLGRLYFGDGRYDAASNAFRRVIGCVPMITVGYNVLGVIQFLQDDLEASRVTFERSVEVDPTDNYFAYSNLGTLHFNAARFADAITVYEEALAISGTEYRVWGNLAFAYAFGAEPEKARVPFEKAIELAEEERDADPGNIELLANLASFYAMVDQPETSRDLLARVVALEPTDSQVYATIGETYEDLNDRDAALEWIGRALDGGIPPRFFDARPMLRDLVADPRYRVLMESDTVPPT